MLRKSIAGLVLALALVSAGIGSALAQGVPAVNSDHCLTGLKQTVQISTSSGATASLVGPQTGLNIYVCAYDFNVVQNATTAQTVVFEYGTGTTCGTGTTPIAGPFTGNITASTPAPIEFKGGNSGNTQFTTNNGGAPVPSQRLCIVTTQSSVVGGYLTYVQE